MSKAYVKFRTKEIVYEEEALEYAIIHTFGNPDVYDEFVKGFCWQDGPKVEITNLFIKKDEDTLELFVDWFFSGDWIKEDIDI